MRGAGGERPRERALGVLLLMALFALHAAVLLQHPVVGTAENGDFWRVTKPAGIVSLDDYASVDHKYVSQTYGLTASQLGSGFSSAAVIAAGAKWLGFGAATLDIRQVGAAYLLLFAATVAGALWAGVPALLCALLAWAALDVSYSLYFNSFFADGAALLGFLGIALCLLAADGAPRHGVGRHVRRALLLFAALVAAFSKNLYTLTPAVAAVAVLAWPCRGWTTHARAEAPLVAALLLGAGLATAHFTYGSGYRFPQINNHNAVFRGLMLVADDPAPVLDELHLDPRLVVFAGKSYFDIDAGARRVSGDALRELSRARLALGYVREPRRFARALPLALAPMRDTTTADPNFSDRTRPPQIYSARWQFAQLRGAPAMLGLVLLGAGVLAIAVAAHARGWSGVPAAMTFLLLNAAWLVVASVLGDGYFGLRRHTMGTRYCLDLALAIVLYEAYGWLRDRGAARGLVPSASAAGRNVGARSSTVRARARG